MSHSWLCSHTQSLSGVFIYDRQHLVAAAIAQLVMNEVDTGTQDRNLAQTITADWQMNSFKEQHFDVIPEVLFQDSLFRYGEERLHHNPKGYQSSHRYQLQMLLDRFGSMMLSEITAKLIQDFANDRLKNVKQSSLFRDLAVLKAILNKAKREGTLSSLPSFPKLKLPKGRCRWITLSEEGCLIEKSPPHLRSLIVFAVETGGRKSELLRLDWSNVELANNRILFIETKNGEDRSIRLSNRAHQELIALGPKDTGPVFTYEGRAIKDIKTSFNKARKKAGLSDVRFHDLRHTFASRLVQQGLPLYEVMQMTGHKSLAMVQRYAHLAPDHQERAIDALNALRTDYWHDLGTVEPIRAQYLNVNISNKSSETNVLEMVPLDRIELSASSLPMMRSTPEL